MRVGPGLVFVLSVIAIAGLALGDITYVASNMRTAYSDVFRSNEARAVLIRNVEVQPEERVFVPQNIGGDAWTVGLVSYDFLIVPGGDGFRLLNGSPPRAIYLERDNMTTQTCCPDGWVAWDRPDDALAHRAPPPIIQTGPGIVVNETDLALNAYDRAERIDLVWVYHWAPGAKQPANQEDRMRFDSARGQSAASKLGFEIQFDPGYPTVLGRGVPRTHTALLSAMSVCALAAAGAAVMWGLRLRRAKVPAGSTDTEELLRLYAAGGVYLEATRDLLLGSLVVVLGVSLHVAITGQPGWVYLLLERAGAAGGAGRVLPFALFTLYTSVVVVWVDAAIRVHRSLRRWRARRQTASSPLDLR